MLTCVLGLLSGILAALALPVMPGSLAGVGILVLGLAMAYMSCRRTPAWWLVGLGLAVLEAGAALSHRLPASDSRRDWLIEGEVETVLSDGNDRTAFLFRADPIRRGRDVPDRIRLVWYQPHEVLSAGERWRLTVRLRDPRGTANHHGFDYERWLLARRIGATGYVRDSSRNTRLAETAAALMLIRARIGDAIEMHLGQGDAARLLKALVSGDRGELSQGTRSHLMETGTAHLLAISGLHVGIAAGTGSIAGRLVGRVMPIVTRVPAVRLGWLGAALAAYLYAALVGQTVATRRALAMALLVCIAGLAGRTSPLFRGLVLAACLVLFANPLSPLDGGFWLSFAAVAILACRFSGRLSFPARFTGLAEAQIAISLGMVVPSLAVFGLVSTTGPLVNLLAVPLVGFVVLPAGLIGAALALFDPLLAGAPFRLAGRGLDGLLTLIDAAATHGPDVVHPAAADPLFLVAGAAGSALLLAPRPWPGRAAAPALLIPLLLWDGAGPPRGALDLTVLDVGQGLSVVVRTHGHAMVYDTGPSWPGGDAGGMTVEPYLQGEGAGQLDALVVSHGDNDHSGGAVSILDRVAGATYAGNGTRLPGVETQPCIAGHGWTWDGVHFQFLHPGPGAVARENDASCVLRIRSRYGTILLPGDIGAPTERELIAAGTDVTADVVVAAHHGSATSSSQVFVDATGAEWVVYAAGYENRWGFPRPEVQARWLAAGARAINTGLGGAVRFRFGPGIPAPRVETYRCTSRRFWRPRVCGSASGDW